jgi:ABC-type branched-subunit amino acid transport system substrate-binding protein
VSDKEIRLGVLAALTTPAGPGFTGFDSGVKARIARANKEGGIAGRKLNVAQVYDDGGDASKDLDAVHAAVQRDNLFALAIVSSYFLPQSSDYLNQNQMPFIGAGYLPGFCGNPNGYGWNGCLLSSTFANGGNVQPIIDGLNLKPKGLKWAVIAPATKTGQSVVAAVSEVVKQTGGQVVYGKAVVPSGQPVSDYNPYVQDLMSTSPDVTILATLLGDNVPLATGMKAAGYKGVIATYSGYVPGLLEKSADTARALDGTYVVNQFPPQEDKSQATKQIQKDLKAIGADPNITIGVGYGYWSADVLVQMLQKVGKDLTPDRFNQVINGGFQYKSTLKGGIQEADYPEFHDRPAPCADLIAIKGTTYKPLIPITCYKNYPVGG